MQHKSIAKLQEQIAILKQENAELRSQLQSFENLANAKQQIPDISSSITEQARSQERDKAEQERASQLASANTALKKTLDVLATEPDLDRSLGHVLQVTTEHLGSPSAALWLSNPNSKTFSLNLVYLNGKVIPATPENAHLLTNQSIRGRDLSRLVLKDHIRDRVPILYDIRDCPQVSESQCQFMKRLGVQALLGVSLLLGSEIVGSFTVRFTEKRQLQTEELELTQALAHQATLAIQLLRMAEEAKQAVLLEERNRMAGEIHDSLAQGFTGIITHLEAGNRALANQNAAKVKIYLDNALIIARASLQEARRSVWALRPQALEQTNFSAALQNWIKNLKSVANIQINTQGQPCILSLEVDRDLLRIAQEAVTNALKHAKEAYLHRSHSSNMEIISVLSAARHIRS
jgi:signal transduction histidine kinase